MSAKHKVLVGFTAAGAVILSAFAAFADGPTKLTNHQLDRVTAGGPLVGASTGALATGNFSFVGTTTAAVLTGSTPYPQQPGLSNTVGAADGTATAVGTNMGIAGVSSPSAATSVITGGTLDGTSGMSNTVNVTAQGAGGVVVQAGWTFVSGNWSGL
jgi:hypothetical protein